jgi:hypothetical protein
VTFTARLFCQSASVGERDDQHAVGWWRFADGRGPLGFDLGGTASVARCPSRVVILVVVKPGVHARLAGGDCSACDSTGASSLRLSRPRARGEAAAEDRTPHPLPVLRSGLTPSSQRADFGTTSARVTGTTHSLPPAREHRGHFRMTATRGVCTPFGGCAPARRSLHSLTAHLCPRPLVQPPALRSPANQL